MHHASNMIYSSKCSTLQASKNYIQVWQLKNKWPCSKIQAI